MFLAAIRGLARLLVSIAPGLEFKDVLLELVLVYGFSAPLTVAALELALITATVAKNSGAVSRLS